MHCVCNSRPDDANTGPGRGKLPEMLFACLVSDSVEPVFTCSFLSSTIKRRCCRKNKQNWAAEALMMSLDLRSWRWPVLQQVAKCFLWQRGKGFSPGYWEICLCRFSETIGCCVPVCFRLLHNLLRLVVCAVLALFLYMQTISLGVCWFDENQMITWCSSP